VNSQPTEKSIEFFSRLKWRELIPYMKEIYGNEFTENLVNSLKEKPKSKIMKMPI